MAVQTAYILACLTGKAQKPSTFMPFRDKPKAKEPRQQKAVFEMLQAALEQRKKG